MLGNLWVIILVLVTPPGETNQFGCAPPNGCKSAKACTQDHYDGFLNNQVLFKCGRSYVCCPPSQNTLETPVENQVTKKPWSKTTKKNRLKTTTELWLEETTFPWQMRSTTTELWNRVTTENLIHSTKFTDGWNNHNRPQRTTEKWNKPSKNSELWNQQSSTESWNKLSTTSEHWQKIPVTTVWNKPDRTSTEFSTTFKQPSGTTEGYDLEWEHEFYSEITSPKSKPFLNTGLEGKKNSNPFVDHKNWKLLPDSCGQTLNNKIVAGDDAQIAEFPWMALIGFTGNNGRKGFVCGGTLISDRYILTAAHCISMEKAFLSHVRLGEFDLSKKEDCDGEVCFQPAIDLEVEKIIVHEGWNHSSYLNDIALLRLNTSAMAFGLATIFPICLPFDTSRLNLSDVYDFETAGWGLTGWRETSLSKILQKTTLEGESLAACNEAVCPKSRTSAFCPIRTTQLCVQGTQKRDVCKGDSGGPLMSSKYVPTVQLGITSFKATELCGQDGIPSVFTRVDQYLNWILDHLEP